MTFIILKHRLVDDFGAQRTLLLSHSDVQCSFTNEIVRTQHWWAGPEACPIYIGIFTGQFRCAFGFF